MNRTYDNANGLLTSIRTGPGGTDTVQWLEHEWDLVGNLKKRRDRNQSSLTETFSYDTLHRLTDATL
jgi:hypothetical protein